MSKLYATVSLAAMLVAHLASVEAVVAAADPSMQAAVERSVRARNDACNLLMGAGRFDGIFGAGALLVDDAGPFTVPLEGLVDELKSHTSHDFALDADRVHGLVLALAKMDPEHPVVVNRDVLREACFHFLAPEMWPAWADVDEAINPPAAPVARDAYGNPVGLASGEQYSTDAPQRAADNGHAAGNVVESTTTSADSTETGA